MHISRLPYKNKFIFVKDLWLQLCLDSRFGNIDDDNDDVCDDGVDDEYWLAGRTAFHVQTLIQLYFLRL